MKRFNKQILEAINRGVQLALDDFDYNEDITKSKTDIINTEEYAFSIINTLYKKLTSEILTVQELDRLVQYYQITKQKYKVYSRQELKRIIDYVIGVYQSGDFVKGLNPDIKTLNWIDVSEVKYMDELFKGLQFTSDISEWDVSNVLTMSNMFENATFTSDISKWNVSKVTTMYGMFSACNFESELSDWDVSHVTDMGHMFFISPFNGDISKWNVKNVTNMPYMFYAAVYFNQPIGKWNMSKVNNIDGMFNMASSFNQDISKWNISNVKSSELAFSKSGFDQDLSKWDGGNLSMTTFKGSKISSNHLPKFWQENEMNLDGKRILNTYLPKDWN